MWKYLLAMVFQAINLMANHPDCGKQERERVGFSGVGHSTGAESSILKNPWTIAILLSNKLHCSGSILSEKYVLTAAHCFVDEGIHLNQTKMTIIAGSDDPTNPIPDNKMKFVEKKTIEDVKIHPLSEVPAARFDLALVKIKGQFTFRDSRWPICIPNKTESRAFHTSKGYSMLGFGRDINKVNKGSVLTELALFVQPTDACSTKYCRILNDEFHDLHIQMNNALPKNFDEDSLICAAKPGQTSGSCPGDSGGIFMRNHWMPDLKDYRAIQTAVVHGAAQRCNGGRYPPIFVRIDTNEVLKWIKSIVFSKNSGLLMVALGQTNPNSEEGGNEKDLCEVINMTDSTSSCNNLPPYPLSLRLSTGHVVNSIPIIAGGHKGSYTSDVYKFDIQSNSWLSMGNLATARDQHSSAVLNDALWLMGGYGPSENLKSTELVYPNGTITSGPYLPTPRTRHCSVQLKDRKILIIGGRTSPSDTNHKVTTIYHPETSKFTNGPDMLFEHENFACAHFNSIKHAGRPVVLSAGGRLGSKSELFDYTQENGTWEEIQDVPYPYTSTLNGPRAVTSVDGNGAYLQQNSNFFELKCTISKCS